MKEHLTELVRAAPTPAHGRNVAREYLQARILGSLQRAGAMIPLAFHGGTALRFLYASPRYSEDLGFALERSRSQYDLRAHLRAIRSEFTREGYAVELKVSDRKVLHGAFVRFPGRHRIRPCSTMRYNRQAGPVPPRSHTTGGTWYAIGYKNWPGTAW